MLRPFAALVPLCGLFCGLLISPVAQAQNPPARGDCISNGMIVLGAFTAQPVMPERGGDPNLTEYAVNLRATRPLRIASVSLRTGGVFGPGIEVELPLGQEVRVGLGRRPGPRLSDSELRGGLRVTCMPA